MEINKDENNNKSFNSVLMEIVEKRFLSSFEQALKIFFDLFIFNNELKNCINESTTLNNNQNYYKNDCYFIREDYFCNFKNFYLYEDIYQALRSDKRDLKKYKASILENLKEKYKQKYIEKISKNNEISFLKDENLFNIEYLLNNNETEMIFLYQYYLLNKAVVDAIYIDDTKAKNNMFKTSYIINNKKLIIKDEQKRSLLIGIISDDNTKNIFIPEIILEYKNIISLLEGFNYFEKNDFSKFESTLIFKEKIK